MQRKRPEENTPYLDTVIVGRVRDLVDGFKVRRVLPSRQRRMVGPFIFLDQMGPEILVAGKGLDVAPHPHIGLSTVTYLFAGELLHRDSLGSVQPIRPGDINWMTAGRGIVHSERTPLEARSLGSKLFGLQSWVALPHRHEETEPVFSHYSVDELPVVEGEGKRVRLITGSLFGARSPVHTLSEMFYADVTLTNGAQLPVPATHEERAAYIVEGSIEFPPESGIFEAGQLLVLKPGELVTLVAAESAESSPVRLMLLGGEPMDGPRHIWWNFVSSSRDRIEQAKADWKARRFVSVPGETEFIALPESGPSVVR